jgi:hypothetical protein
MSAAEIVDPKGGVVLRVDVLQKDQAEDDVLVLGGVHRPAQGVRHLPELEPK